MDRMHGIRDEAFPEKVIAERRKGAPDEMKKAAVYVRVSTVDQHPETQLLDLRQFAAQKGLQLL